MLTKKLVSKVFQCFKMLQVGLKFFGDFLEFLVPVVDAIIVAVINIIFLDMCILMNFIKRFKYLSISIVHWSSF